MWTLFIFNGSWKFLHYPKKIHKPRKIRDLGQQALAEHSHDNLN